MKLLIKNLFYRGGLTYNIPLIPPSTPMYNLLLLQEGINSDLQDGYNKGQAIRKGVLNGDIKPQEAGARVLSKGMSVVGGLLLWVPHPLTRVVGTALTVPDTYYDTKDFINDPSVGNGASLILDIPSKIGNVPGYVDDIFRGTSILDDATGLPSNTILGGYDQIRKKFFIPKDSIYLRPLTYRK